MIRFFAKYFIKDHTNTQDAAVRRSYGVLCGAMGIVLNLFLFIGKIIAGTLTNSIAVTADAINNLSDAGSSIITLFGFKLAGQKPDPDHPFGHGRIEYVSGLIVSMLILLMGFELLKGSVEKIRHPEELSFSIVAVIILVISILAKIYMYLYNRTYGKRIASAAMQATATDSLSDTLATSVVLIATIISYFTNVSIDGWCGLLVGLFICYAGVNSAKETIDPLLGQAPDPAFVQQIHETVMAHEEILGTHDLIVHNYGPGRVLISLHAEVPSNGDLLALHDLIDTIEHELNEILHCHAVIHMDPIQIDDPQTQILSQAVHGYITSIDNRLSMHDFRIVTGPTHTNLIFDVVTPYHFQMSDRELVDKISAIVKEHHPNHFCVIDVDKQMV